MLARGHAMTHEPDTSSVDDDAGDPSLDAPRRALMSRAGPRHDLDGDSVAKRLARRALFPTKAEKVTIGRFTVLRQIGQGGMGVVYACHDHELDRKVAVKLLRADVTHGLSAADTRLIREAQAMARLSHPNIVTVHEVGRSEGSVHVAMEFIDGTSLDAWLKQPRSWREIVAAFVQAGRGLAAAHRAGVVHRDFKPQNAMMTADGTVKVLDFGLARAAEGGVPEELLASASSGGADDVLMGPLTRTGALLGTPAYMSPEQHRGEPATAASDQFNFCVSLYQSLYGALPFSSGSYAALRDDVMQGRVAPPPARSGVPPYVFKALQRGMSPRVADRFASMDELLARIERDPRAKLRRGAALLASLTATGATSVALFGGEAIALCPDARAELTGVWDDARAEEVRAAVRAADPTYAAETLALVEPRIERYASAWAHLRNDACRAHAEGRQSMQVFDLRTACLDQRRASLDSVVDALVGAEASNVELRTRAAASLPALDGCSDVDALMSAIPPPAEPASRAQVQRHREALARAAVLEQTAQIPRGLDLVEAVLADPVTASYEPLRAEAYLGKGGLQMRDGAWSAALRSFEEALWTALGIGHAPVAAQASSRRGFLLATPLTRPEQALADLPMITALNRRVQRDVELHAEFLVNAGTIHMQVHEFARARESWQAAAALLEARGRLETPLGLNALANAAILAIETEQLEDAVASLRRVVTLSEEIMGPRQPERANYEGVLSGALIDLGRPREALERMRGLHARMDAVQSAGARFVATLLLARAEMMAGAPRSALRHMDELQRTEPALFGPVYAPMTMLAAALDGDGPAVREAQVAARAYLDRSDPREPGFKQAIRYYAWAARAAGLDAESIAPLERARAAFAGAEQPGDVVAGARMALELGRARVRLGELDVAARDLLAAQTAFERSLPPNHLDRAEVLSALAELALMQGRVSEAVTRVGEAEAIYAATAEPDYPPRLRARALLARATASLRAESGLAGE